MSILSVDLNKSNLDDHKLDEDNRETIILVRLKTWHNRLKQRKALKKILAKIVGLLLTRRREKKK